MIRTQVYLPDDQYRELKLLAATGEMNISQLIRKGIDGVIKKNAGQKRKKPFQNLLGNLTYGPKNLSTKIDTIYQ